MESEERRIELTEGELQALVTGDSVHRDGVGVLLQNIGFDRIQLAMRRGMSEAARRSHAGEPRTRGYAELT